MRYQAEAILADVQRQCSHMGFTSYPELASRLQTTVRELCAKLNALQGHEAAKKHRTHWVGLNEVDVLVAYDIDPDIGPFITEVWMGDWVDSQSFAPETLLRWEQEIAHAMTAEADEQRTQRKIDSILDSPKWSHCKEPSALPLAWAGLST